jgi:ubiquinone/menaquinone biosynthesis C-methylase UbiE
MDDQERKTILKETFNTVSKGYDNKALGFFPASARHLADVLNLRGDEQVLDVATGTGHAALALASCLPQGRVVGVDFSPGMLDQARRKAASLNVANIDFIERDMQHLGFTAPEFDAAVCAFGIFFVDDMDLQLSHIAAAVKPGGHVAICNFQEDYFHPLRELMARRLGAFGVQQPPQTWKRIATEEGCRNLFSNAGLRDIRVEQKNVGYFLDSEEEWWDVIWNAGFRRMVGQLTSSDQERFRREHMQEVAALKTKDGIWLDVGVLFTIGTKV